MNHPDRLTCEEMFRRLDDYLDRELDDVQTAKVREHLETCVVCAREFAFEESVLNDVRAKLRRVSAPPDLMEKVSRMLGEAMNGRPDRS